MKRRNLSYVLVDPFDDTIVCVYPVDNEYNCIFQKMDAIKDARERTNRGVPMSVYGCINNEYSEGTKIFPR